MSDPIFAIPRYPYASYADLYTLIALSSFQQCFIDEIQPDSDNTYIVTIYNGEFGDYSSATARIILYDLEYHMGDNALPPLPNVELWAADKWYAEQIGAKYVPMGSHEGLRTNGEGIYVENYDVAYLGFIRGLHRREVIERQLLERGVCLSPPVAWGAERDAVLRHSKVYLHVHQHAHIPAVPPLRMVVAAAYGLPVVSETCGDVGVFDNHLSVIEYDLIAEWIYRSTTQQRPPGFSAILEARGQALHQFLCVDYTFRKSVEAVRCNGLSPY